MPAVFIEKNYMKIFQRLWKFETVIAFFLLLFKCYSAIFSCIYI